MRPSHVNRTNHCVVGYDAFVEEEKDTPEKNSVLVDAAVANRDTFVLKHVQRNLVERHVRCRRLTFVLAS